MEQRTELYQALTSQTILLGSVHCSFLTFHEICWQLNMQSAFCNFFWELKVSFTPSQIFMFYNFLMWLFDTNQQKNKLQNAKVKSDRSAIEMNWDNETWKLPRGWILFRHYISYIQTLQFKRKIVTLYWPNSISSTVTSICKWLDNQFQF